MPRTVYLDHGAYFPKAPSFTALFNANSSTLTVQSMDPGSEPIMIGMRILHPALDYYTYISTFGTGSGGAGTYTMTAPAPVSSGGYVSMQGEGGVTTKEVPEWGFAQEGDGLLPGVSKPAIAAFSLAGVTAAAGARLFVAGAELICASPGTAANQFPPGSGATLAANIAAAINRAANTALVSPAAADWTPHKVQDAIIARVNPMNNTGVQLMTRAGSAAYNNNPQFSITYSTTGWTGLSGGPFVFSGGVSGAWGMVASCGVTQWASGMIAYSYGLFSTTFSLAGSVVPGDTIICRGHKRQAGVSAFLLNNPNVVAVPVFSGTEENPIFIKNDDGTVWPEDGPEPVFEMMSRVTGSSGSYRLSPPVNAHIYFEGTAYPSGKNGIRFSCTSPSPMTTPQFVLRTGHLGGYANVDLYGYDYGLPAFSASIGGNAIFGRTRLTGCLISWWKQRDSASMLYAEYASTDHGIDMDDCVFEQRDPDAPQLGGILTLFGTQSAGSKVTMRGVRFKGFRPGSALVSTPPVPSSILRFTTYMLNCDFGGITNFGPNFRENTRVASDYAFGGMGLYISSMYGKNLMVADNPMGSVIWNPLQDQPCLNARLYDNSSWSYRVIPSRNVGNLSFHNPLEVPIFSKTVTAATGVKRITANFLMEKAMRWTRRDLAIVVSYVDAGGNLRSENTVSRMNQTPLQPVANPNVWTRPLGGSVMTVDPADGMERAAFNDAGVNIFFDQYALSITTKHPVKTGTEVGIVFRITRNVTYSIDQLFIDPDVQIEDVAP